MTVVCKSVFYTHAIQNKNTAERGKNKHLQTLRKKHTEHTTEKERAKTMMKKFIVVAAVVAALGMTACSSSCTTTTSTTVNGITTTTEVTKITENGQTRTETKKTVTDENGNVLSVTDENGNPIVG